MTADTIVHAALGLLAVLQTTWFLIYVTGPWRATPLGWVWLLKGGLLSVVWSLLFVDEYHDVPDVTWAVLGVAMIVATVAWLWATIRARWGDLS